MRRNQCVLPLALSGLIFALSWQARAEPAREPLFKIQPGPAPEQIVRERAAAAAKQWAGMRDYAAGAEAIRAARYDDAIAAFGRALAANEEQAFFYMGRGIAYGLSEKFQQASSDINRSLQLMPGNPLSLLWSAALRMIAAGPKGQPLRETFGMDFTQPLSQPLYAWSQGCALGSQDAARLAAARKQAPALAKAIAQHLLEGQNLMPVLLEQAVDLESQGKFAEAEDPLALTRNAYKNDPNWLYFDAACALALGRAETAREEFTRVLEARPDLAAAYLAHGLANARLGGLNQAASDFYAASQIDPKLAADFRAQHAAELASLAASIPKEPPAQLAAELLDAAKKGEPFDKLIEKATALERGMNAIRKRADEQYEDALRRLQAEVAAEPRNSDRWADIAKYVFQQAVVRTVWNGPRNPEQDLRNQDPQAYQHERLLAEQYADRALALNPNTLSAIATKGWLLHHRGMDRDALEMANRGLQLAPDYPRLARLKTVILEITADTQWAEGARLRAPKMFSGPGWWVTFSPSPAEIEEARKYEARSTELLGQASASEREAFRKYAGTADGLVLQGDYFAWLRDYTKAAEKYEEALKLDPGNVDALGALADAYALHLNQPDKALPYHVRAIATMATTAALLLEPAWACISQTRWKSAREALDKAMELDPADARVYAYRAVVESWESHLGEANTYWRSAAALEEARMRLNGLSFMVPHGPPLTKQDALLAAEALYGLFRAEMAAGKTQPAIGNLRASRAVHARATLDSDRTDLPFIDLPRPANPGPGPLPPSEDGRMLMAKANFILAQDALKAGRLEEAARCLTAIRHAGYIGGQDVATTRAWVYETSYQIFVQLRKTPRVNQFNGLFDGEQIAEFLSREQGFPPNPNR